MAGPRCRGPSTPRVNRSQRVSEGFRSRTFHAATLLIVAKQ
jgi:hypothetical protein